MTSFADCTTAGGELSIGGLSMHTEAWGILEPLTPLWVPLGWRGENDVLPGVDGRQENPLYVDEANHEFRMVIRGEVDQTGAPQSDRHAGLRANILALRAVTEPPASSTGTRAAVLTLPGGGSLSGSVQPLGLRMGVQYEGTSGDGVRGLVQRATLRFRIPAGLLT